MTVKEIGVRLAMEGFQRDGGGAWYPSLVVSLLATATRDGASASKPCDA